MNVVDIQKMFPAETKILNVELISESSYIVHTRLKCTSKEEFQLWLAEHQELSGIVYRVASTLPRVGTTVVYKATYRCQHNTYPASHGKRVKCPSKKHTGCGAKLRVTIKSPVEGRRVRSQDALRGEFPTIVKLIHNHNHDIGFYEPLKNKKQKKPIPKRSLKVFKSQHSPTEALELHKRNLFEVCKDPYYSETSSDDWNDNSLVTSENSQIFNMESQDESKTNNTVEVEDIKMETVYVQEPLQESFIWEESEKKLKEICEIFKMGYEKNPQEMSHAITAFHSRVKCIKNDAIFYSAMHNFGKFYFKAICA